MMLRITTNIVRGFSRRQNFFEMNPIYPDYGEKDFDIYNSHRKKINLLDNVETQVNRRAKIKDAIRKKMVPPMFKKKEYQYEKGDLPIDMDGDLVQYLHQISDKAKRADSIKSGFTKALGKLIQDFKLKDQVQLMKLFRISIANMQKNQIKDKLRGKVMHEALLKTVQQENLNNELLKSQIDLEVEEDDEEAFEQALKELDEKIAQVQQDLGVQQKYQVLKQYDREYGWREERKQIINKNYDLNVKRDIYSIVKTTSIPGEKEETKDWAIRTRINRLYFLKRLEMLKKNKEKFIADKLNFPIKLRQNQKIMNELASRYRQEQLLQEPDLNEIYRQVDIVLEKVYVNLHPTSYRQAETKRQLKPREYERENFLWENIKVEEVLSPCLYTQSEDIPMDYQRALEVSPAPSVQVNVNKIPINFHRHSELDIFSVFSDHKKRMLDGILDKSLQNYMPAFKYYDIDQASKKYEKVARKQLKQRVIEATCKRKTSEAEAKIMQGTGKVTVNGIPIQEYFPDTYYRVEALKPIGYTFTGGQIDVVVNVVGGGKTGQAECISYAIAKALVQFQPQFIHALSKVGLIGKDTRKKEKKKTNLYAARARYPYVRR